MPRWLRKALRRIRQFAAAGAVRLTYKAVSLHEDEGAGHEEDKS